MFGIFGKKVQPLERKTDNFKISVIMPVFLGDYDGCADNREEKFKSAVISFTRQSYKNCELIIISDGCDGAEKIYNGALVYDNIIFKKIDKQLLFSGNVRAEGLKLATGDIICYLDSDDMFGVNHLKSIATEFKYHSKFDWVYYNDLIIQPNQEPINRPVEVIEGSIGTSSICHRKECKATWKGCDGYGHDWSFITQLINQHPSHGKIYGAEYFVCHIPNIF